MKTTSNARRPRPDLLARPGAVAGACASSSTENTVDEYVAKPDVTYSWKLVNTIPGDGYTTFIVDINCKPGARRRKSIGWRHGFIVKPDASCRDPCPSASAAARTTTRPRKPAPRPSRTRGHNRRGGACMTQSAVDPQRGRHRAPRTTSSPIATSNSWTRATRPGWSGWPMVRRAHAHGRGDGILASEKEGKTTVKKFVVAGGSKRGWIRPRWGRGQPGGAAHCRGHRRGQRPRVR